MVDHLKKLLKMDFSFSNVRCLRKWIVPWKLYKTMHVKQGSVESRWIGKCAECDVCLAMCIKVGNRRSPSNSKQVHPWKCLVELEMINFVWRRGYAEKPKFRNATSTVYLKWGARVTEEMINFCVHNLHDRWTSFSPIFYGTTLLYLA